MNTNEYAVFKAKPGKEKLIKTAHPWVFSGALEFLETRRHPESLLQNTAMIQDADGGFLAWAQYNKQSKIRLRLCSLKAAVVPDSRWLEDQVKKAFDLRQHIFKDTNAYRAVFAESDGIPGLILDIFSNYAVVQLETSGADSWRSSLKELIPEVCKTYIPELKAVLEFSDGDGRSLEGLEAHQELWWGAAFEEDLEIQENQARLCLSLGSQKTGFYADQRDNRLI